MRALFREPTVPNWQAFDPLHVSMLAVVEVGRVIDRARHEGRINDEDVATLHDDARAIFGRAHIVALSAAILTRAGGPFPTTVGTLDAIHVSAAVELAVETATGVRFLTHDRQQALAARALGLDVVGV